MINRKPQKAKGGMVAIEYGDTGVGKSYSTIQTALRPIKYIECDPKPIERSCEDLNFDNIDISHPEGFLDLRDYLAKNADKIAKEYRTLFLDPLSHLMNVILMREIEEETGRANVFNKKIRPLVNMGRTDMTGYGSAASLMKSLCNILGQIAIKGVYVICSAHLDQMPKWNRELSAAPAFAGKEFPRDMKSYFDLIGLVETRKGIDSKTKESKVIYPPKISFRSPDDDFLCKWSGKSDAKGIGLLDWGKILGIKENKK